MSRLPTSLLIAALTLPNTSVAALQHPDLAAGIRQVEEGDLETAVVTLDGVIQRLSGAKGRETDLAMAHLYIAMAHLGLNHIERARASVREAWRSNRDLTIDAARFPPTILQYFEDAKKDASLTMPAQPPTVATSPRPSADTTSGAIRKATRPKPLLLLLGVGAAAVAAGGAYAYLARIDGDPGSLAPTTFGPDNRPVQVQGTVVVVGNTVTFELRDNGQVDGDVVTFVVNGTALATNVRLTDVTLRLTANLNPGNNFALLYVNSEGTKPGSTISVLVADGASRQFLAISSNRQISGAYDVIVRQ